MKKIEIKSILDYKFLSQLNANDNNTKVTFVQSEADYDENKYIHNLYYFDGNQKRKLFTFKGSPVVSWEDENSFLFRHNETKKDEELLNNKHTILYRYDTSNGELEKAFDFKIPVDSFDIIDDNQILLMTSFNEDDLLLLDDSKRAAYIEKEKEESYCEVFESVPFQMNGGGFVNDRRGQAYLYDITQDTYAALFDFEEEVVLLEYVKNKQKAYFMTTPVTGKPEFFGSIIEFDFATRKAEVLYNKNEYMINSFFILNDLYYVTANNGKEYGINQNDDFYQLIDGELKHVCKFGLSSNNSIGSDVRLLGSNTTEVYDDSLYFVGTYRDRSVLYQFDGDTVKTVFDILGSLDSFAFINNQLYGIGLFENRLQELYTLDLKTQKLRLLTDFNEDNTRDSYVAKPEHLEFENDGQVLDGWVLKPYNYVKGESYPAILDIHGGPKTIYNEVFYHEMQVWASEGYFVFFCNPRGGDAYGDVFADIRGKYGTIDYQDIMKFTDIVLEKYPIDSKRVGVTGGSYGGFMTNWIVSHTNRFAAAATQRSISNWVSFYGTSDIGPYFAPDQTTGDIYGDIYKNYDEHWNHSPLKYAQNIETPLLFIHSDKDYRCPIEQAMQLFTVVRMKGVDTRFVWMHGENHELSRSGKPKARIKRLEEITNWMNQYLK